MKQKATQNYSGITVCDSIVVSVKKKHRNLRKLESVIIAVIGFASVIMSFIDMFSFRYKTLPVAYTAVICSAIYIIISLYGKKALPFYLSSVLIFAAAAFKYLKSITNGFKYVYNIIYRDSFHTEINYFKFLKAENEVYCVTVFFIFCIWLLALIIYFFTIYKPNPIITVLVTFPIIEIGLYNGIKIPVLWGMLTIAYWFAMLSVSTTDIGEYSGGSGGFVRKGNLFYPKRQMKLKVTEKCAVLVISAITAVTVISLAVMHLTGYERSDKLNQRRAAIKQAVNSFSFDDLASSLSALTESFGFTFEYESHKLGTNAKVGYKGETDLIVTFDKKYDGAIYLKGYSGSVYDDNEWFELNDAALNREKQMFSDFSSYSIYPQDFPHIFVAKAYPELSDITIWIENKNKKNKSYAPYCTDNYGNLTYKYDTVLTSQNKGRSEYSYKFIGASAEMAAEMLDSATRTLYSAGEISDSEWRSSIESYCSENELYSYDDYFAIDGSIRASLISQYDFYNSGQLMMASLLENDYRSFVYENYLQVPDNENFAEVEEAFSDILAKGASADTASDKLELLTEIRDRINTMAEYSLSPGKTPQNRDFVNYFLLENHKGYCTHFATAGVLLARMAGIPARYSTGYIIVGDDFNKNNMEKDGSYAIDVQDNRSHAWAEVYFDGFGWVPFEFTAGYSDMSINTNTTAVTSTTSSLTRTTTSTPKSSNTSKSSSKSTSRTTSANTTTATVKSKSNPDDRNTEKTTLSDTQKNLILIVLTIAAVIIIMLLRRYLTILMRRKKFNDKNKRKSTAAIYNYTERLLSFLDIRKEDMTYSDFADFVESKLCGAYFAENEFRSLIKIALQGSFDQLEPSDSDLAFARKFAGNFSKAVYDSSGFFRKFCLKYIYSLI